MKSVTNRVFMAKKMYKKPETEAVSVNMTTTLCGSNSQNPVGFGSSAAIGGDDNL